MHSMVIVRVEMADSGQFTCLAENIAGEARSTADLVVRPAGSEPGSYFHVTKVLSHFYKTFSKPANRVPHSKFIYRDGLLQRILFIQNSFVIVLHLIN